MILKNGIHGVTFTLLVCLVALLGTKPAVGQDGDSTAQLKGQLNTLYTMTDTVGPMRSAATQRAALMKSFISETDREDAWKAWSSQQQSSKFNGMSFDEAYKQAMTQQQSRGAVKPSGDRPPRTRGRGSASRSQRVERHDQGP